MSFTWEVFRGAIYSVEQINAQNLIDNKNCFLNNKWIYFIEALYTVKIRYKLQKLLDVAISSGLYFFQAGLEAGAGVGDGVHVWHGGPDGCLADVLRALGFAVHLPFEDVPHEIDEMTAIWRWGGRDKSGDQWYGEQMASHARMISNSSYVTIRPIIRLLVLITLPTGRIILTALATNSDVLVAPERLLWVLRSGLKLSVLSGVPYAFARS